MENLTDYINKTNSINSPLTNDNDTVKHKDVNEKLLTEYDLDQYVDEYKNNEELNYRIFLSRNYRI